MEKRDKDRLLANFVGTVTGTSLLNRDEDQYQWSFPFCDGYYPSLNTMKFDKSWDWLIPVYSKWRVSLPRDTTAEYFNAFVNTFNSCVALNVIDNAYEYLVIEIKKLKDG